MPITPHELETAKNYSEIVAAIGAAIMAVLYGIRRMYRMARNVDELVKEIKENNTLVKLALSDHSKLRSEHEALRTELVRLETKVDALAEEIHTP